MGLLGVLVVGISGCEVEPPASAERPGPRLVPVRGTVTVDGKPLKGAVVIFLPVSSDLGTHSVGETVADGSYELSHLGRPGAGPGDYRVGISYLVGPNGKIADLAARSSDFVPPEVDRGKEYIPARYSDLSRTELRATVEPGAPPIDFALEGPLLAPFGSSGPTAAAIKAAESTAPPDASPTAREARSSGTP